MKITLSMFKNLRIENFQAGFIRLTKKSLVMSLIALLVFTGTGLYLLIHPKPAAAAWYDDNWAYRTSYSNNNTGAAVTNQW